LDQLTRLPFIHHDPFDRMLMATAPSEGMTIILASAKKKNYFIVARV
jgi:PIN domain nuclease of toxin-antitoxin system